jgi:hypothetical protein
VLALARHVPLHAPLGVVEGLHLQERRAAAGDVLTLGLAEHEPLAAQVEHALELGLEVVEVVADLVDERLGVLHPVEGLLDDLEALLEVLVDVGRVEHPVHDVLPTITLAPAAHDADGLLEFPSIQEELPVERRLLRQILDEPIGRGEGVPQPRDELLAVPVRADPVELLAHPPACGIVLVLPLVREQERRRVGLARRRRRARRRARPARGRGGPYARGLLGVAAVFAQVLAGALVDGRALVLPRGAAALIDVALALERVDARAGALDLRFFAVVEIGHMSP